MQLRYFIYLILLVALFAFQTSYAQRHLISEVKMDRSSVYVGQPVKVSVGVYTSTWFTSGVNPGNIKVNGAFTVFFRSLSTSKNVDGKNYSGVELTFNVFPYDDEDIIFPALEIEVETPDEGGFKGVKRIVKTTERKIKVRPIPKGYEKDEWLVAYGMTVDDNWTGDLSNVKVGDVLERTISRKVSGTVAELIPPVIWDTLEGASLYPSRSEVNSEKTKTAIRASRTEGMRYLFETEGEVVVPEMILTWWNPDRNKLYKRTLKSYTINVQRNPDLGMLESVRDSLAVATLPQETETDKSLLEQLKEKFSWEQLIMAGLVLLILIRVVYKIFKWVFVTKQLVKLIKGRRQKYRQSEKYYFNQFKSAARKKHPRVAVQKLYQWIDQIHLEEPTINFFVETYGNEELVSEANALYEVSEKDEKKKHHISVGNWSKARRNYLRSKDKKETKDAILWINP
jgi:hypothetical protein